MIYKNMSKKKKLKPLQPTPNILIQETLDKFGYDVTKLFGSINYEKIVICVCQRCSRTSEVKYITAVKRYKKQLICLACHNGDVAKNNAENNSIRMKELYANGYIHPMQDKQHSEKSKQQMSESHKGQTWEVIHGKQKADDLRSRWTLERSGTLNAFYGKKHSIESLQKMSLTQTKIARRGSASNFYGKKYWSNRNNFEYNGTKYRSRWEIKTVQYFETNNIEFVYEPKAFELVNCTYRPDFYLTDLDKWIEVKGYLHPDAKFRMDEFQRLYPELIFEIWDETKLKELNII